MRDLISQNLAARQLGLSIKSLERHRLAGTGPKFVKLGRLVKYRQEDIDAWVNQNLRSSTSDQGAA